MEDEIASMATVIGASMGGVKAMTATSGPGFSLKQENIGYAAGAEIPCVIVNVMRGGPSTGMPTRPSQADIMQARWGSHGDYPIIVLTPASVSEIYSETLRAFDLAEQCRSPVVLLYDQVIAQLSETVALDGAGHASATRKWASGPRAAYQPYDGGSDAILAALAVMSFAPIKFLHPLRVRHWRVLNIALLAAWAALAFLAVINDLAPGPYVTWPLVAIAIYFFGAGLLRRLA
jgi:pyruvate/2-oxoacid:ferredoxin oxidoreductase alpha subunit